MPGGRRHGTGQGPGAHAAATGRPVPVSSAAQPLPVAQNQLTLRPTQDAPGFRPGSGPSRTGRDLAPDPQPHVLPPDAPLGPRLCPFPSLAPTPPPWSPSWPHRTSFLTQNVPPRSSDKRRAGVRALHAQVCRPRAAAKDGASPACAPRLTLPARSAQTKAARRGARRPGRPRPAHVLLRALGPLPRRLLAGIRNTGSKQWCKSSVPRAPPLPSYREVN